MLFSGVTIADRPSKAVKTRPTAVYQAFVAPGFLSTGGPWTFVDRRRLAVAAPGFLSTGGPWTFVDRRRLAGAGGALR